MGCARRTIRVKRAYSGASSAWVVCPMAIAATRGCRGPQPHADRGRAREERGGQPAGEHGVLHVLGAVGHRRVDPPSRRDEALAQLGGAVAPRPEDGLAVLGAFHDRLRELDRSFVARLADEGRVDPHGAHGPRGRDPDGRVRRALHVLALLPQSLQRGQRVLARDRDEAGASRTWRGSMARPTMRTRGRWMGVQSGAV